MKWSPRVKNDGPLPRIKWWPFFGPYMVTCHIDTTNWMLGISWNSDKNAYIGIGPIGIDFFRVRRDGDSQP